MKLNFAGDEILLSELTDMDISFCNLAGNNTNSIFGNPDKPEHSMKVVVKDPEIVEKLRSIGLTLTEKVTGDGDPSFTVKLKCRPRTRFNKITETNVVVPRITVKDPSCDSIILGIDDFKLVDSAVFNKNVIDICIAFHVFLAQPWNKLTTAIDEVKLVVKDFEQLSSDAAINRPESYFPDGDEPLPWK